MFFAQQRNKRMIAVVIYVVAAAFVLSTAILGVDAILSRQGRARSSSTRYIATVNGSGITEMEYYQTLSQFRGMYPTFAHGEDDHWLRAYVLDELIDRTLLFDEAKKASIKVSDSEINAQVDSERSAYSNPKDYETALSMQGMTLNDRKQQIKNSLMVEKYQEQIASKAEVTDDEIKAEFDKRKASNDTLILDDVKDQIRQDLLDQKKQKLIISRVDALRSAASIQINDNVINAVKAAQDGKDDDALSYYRSAIAEDPTGDPYLYVAVARILDKKGEKDEALAQYKEAAEVDGGVNADILLFLGQAYKDREMLTEAADTLRKASDLDGERDGSLHSSLQTLFEQMSLKDDAEKEAAIVKKISDAEAKAWEEYLQQLQAAQPSQSSDGTSSSDTSSSDTPATQGGSSTASGSSDSAASAGSTGSTSSAPASGKSK